VTERGAPSRLRPLHFLAVLLLAVAVVHGALYLQARQKKGEQRRQAATWDIVTSALGLTDLCVATEARYTRHPAVTDPVAPFMDHPGAIEHFPTGSFWACPDLFDEVRKR
jgi:hypothetical protein